MTSTKHWMPGTRGLAFWIPFTLWSFCYLLITISVYANYTEQGNPIFSFATDSIGWFNGAQGGNELRSAQLVLFRHLMPRLFGDNWTAYLVMMCMVLWLNACMANLICAALVDRYGAAHNVSANARSLAGGAAGLLTITYDTNQLLDVARFVYPMFCFFLLLL